MLITTCDHILYPACTGTGIVEFPLISTREEYSSELLLRYGFGTTPYLSGVVPFPIFPTVVSLDGTFISLANTRAQCGPDIICSRRTRKPQERPLQPSPYCVAGWTLHNPCPIITDTGTSTPDFRRLRNKAFASSTGTSKGGEDVNEG